jgi:hypothetical protein
MLATSSSNLIACPLSPLRFRGNSREPISADHVMMEELVSELLDALDETHKKEIQQAIHEALYDLNFEKRLELRRRKEQDAKWNSIRESGKEIDDHEIKRITRDRFKVDDIFRQREAEIIEEVRARFEVKLLLNRNESAASILKRLKQMGRSKLSSIDIAKPTVLYSDEAKIAHKDVTDVKEDSSKMETLMNMTEFENWSSISRELSATVIKDSQNISETKSLEQQVDKELPLSMDIIQNEVLEYTTNIHEKTKEMDKSSLLSLSTAQEKELVLESTCLTPNSHLKPQSEIPLSGSPRAPRIVR